MNMIGWYKLYSLVWSNLTKRNIFKAAFGVLNREPINSFIILLEKLHDPINLHRQVVFQREMKCIAAHKWNLSFHKGFQLLIKSSGWEALSISGSRRLRAVI